MRGSSAPVAHERPLELDQLCAAYAAAHLSVAWAEFVLDHIVDRRDELLERHDHDDRATRMLEWLRDGPAPPTRTFDADEGGSPCAARSYSRP